MPFSSSVNPCRQQHPDTARGPWCRKLCSMDEWTTAMLVGASRTDPPMPSSEPVFAGRGNYEKTHWVSRYRKPHTRECRRLACRFRVMQPFPRTAASAPRALPCICALSLERLKIRAFTASSRKRSIRIVRLGPKPSV